MTLIIKDTFERKIVITLINFFNWKKTLWAADNIDCCIGNTESRSKNYHNMQLIWKLDNKTKTIQLLHQTIHQLHPIMS